MKDKTTFGFVRVARYAEAIDQQKKAESRALKLQQQLEVAREESRGWKGKADQAQEALKKAQASAAEVRRNLERCEARAADMQTLQQRLAESERALIIAREQLMAIEVKLDILEGAANVLDARTRTVIMRGKTTERGAPV
jgi:DNA repair exonuclease SbcCD ATPase subunit